MPESHPTWQPPGSLPDQPKRDVGQFPQVPFPEQGYTVPSDRYVKDWRMRIETWLLGTGAVSSAVAEKVLTRFPILPSGRVSEAIITALPYVGVGLAAAAGTLYVLRKESEEILNSDNTEKGEE